MWWRAYAFTSPFCGPTRWHAWRSRRWHSSAARSRTVAGSTPSSAWWLIYSLRVCFALADVLALFIVGVTGVASIEFIESSWSERTPIFQMPAATIALPLTLGLALLALHAVDHLRREHGVRAWKVGGAVALGIAQAMVTRPAWLPWFTGDTARNGAGERNRYSRWRREDGTTGFQ